MILNEFFAFRYKKRNKINEIYKNYIVFYYMWFCGQTMRDGGSTK